MDPVLVAENQWQRYCRLRDHGHLDYVRTAKKCDNFYHGDQWNDEDKATLEAQGRPALTLNMSMPLINTIVGEFMQEMAHVEMKPVFNATAAEAKVLDKLIAATFSSADYYTKEAELVQDGLIQDRGFIDIRLDFTKRIPELEFSIEDPLDILIDIDAKHYDPMTWQEVIKSKWVSLDDISISYGTKAADKLQHLANNAEYYGSDSMEVYENSYGDSSLTTDEFITNEEWNREIRKIRVIERQYYKRRRVHYLVDSETGDEKRCPMDWSEEKCQEFAERMQIEVLTRVEKAVMWCVTADKVTLHNEWSPYKHFTIIPYFPFFRRGRPLGLMRNLLSPQELINKVSSQELHVVNTTANSGYLVPANSLVNMTIEELEQRGAETGLVIEYNPTIGIPGKIDPNKIPTGLDRIGQKAAGFIRDISGVHPAVDGSDDPETSGKALNIKAARALVQTEVPRANLKRTREYIVRHMLDIIQEYYTEERVVVITNPKIGRSPETPEEEQLVINQRTLAGEVLNNVTKGSFKPVVGTRPSSDTYNEAQLREALLLRNHQVAVPDDVIVAHSNLDNREEVADRIRRATGQNPPTPQEQQAAQMVQEIKLENIKLQLSLLRAQVRKEETAAHVNEAEAYAKIQKLENDMQELLIKTAADKDKTEAMSDAQIIKAELDSLTKLQAARMSSSTQRIANGNQPS